ncbi:MAG: hypothetical protein AB2531_12280, partial [Candidatus Thiodiazotropha sp.]
GFAMAANGSKEQSSFSKYKNLLRTNYGVVFRSLAEFSQASSFWYHHFVMDLPKLDDVVLRMHEVTAPGRSISIQSGMPAVC